MRQGGGRDKGNAYELDTAWWMSYHYFKNPRILRRTPGSGGWSQTKAGGDLISEIEPYPFTIECKHNKAWSFGELLNPGWGELGSFWYQCKGECKINTLPALVFRGNNTADYMAITGAFAQAYDTSFPTFASSRMRLLDKDGALVVFMKLKTDFLKADFERLYEILGDHVKGLPSRADHRLICEEGLKKFPPTVADLTFISKNLNTP